MHSDSTGYYTRDNRNTRAALEWVDEVRRELVAARELLSAVGIYHPAALHATIDWMQRSSHLWTESQMRGMLDEYSRASAGGAHD